MELNIEVSYSSTCPCSAAFGSAVQTAVKRADEQAFALANGQNLMFCEDAARRLNSAIRPIPAVEGFRIRVIPAERLHSNDAVAESAGTGKQADPRNGIA